MRKTGKSTGREVIAVSGGPDSVYLACRTLKESKSAILAHLDHGAREKDSEKDREFVERLGRSRGMPVEVRKIAMGKTLTGFEKKARNARYAFLRECKEKHGAEKILVAHTADDQVETVLMRILEGAGISGLKGIPRKTRDGIERPILDIWREDILQDLRKHKIPYRVDKSNFDTRFERNWVRHVLIPLLEKRYGKSVKKRIFALGERFREIDAFLEETARKWMKRNVTTEKDGGQGGAGGPGEAARGGVRLPRRSYSRLPSVVRKKILQLLCFERARVAPNERLLASMDRLILHGGPSARLAIGKRETLSCSYDDARLTPERRISTKQAGKAVRMTGPGTHEHSGGFIRWEEKEGGMRASAIRNRSEGEQAALFDAGSLRLPLTVRPLRYGDRIRPFGMDAEKKVKEILIDRKVPRGERWGRPAVCDAEGAILWIPGVIRSAHAPVTPRTRRSVRLRISGRNA